MQGSLLADLVIQKVRSVSNLYTLKGKKGKRKKRPCWAILIKYEGETVYKTSNGKKILSDLHHGVVLPAGCDYVWECTKSGHFFTIEFEGNFQYAEPLSFHLKNGEKIRNMFQELEYKRNMKTQTAEIESIRDVYSILLALIATDDEQYIPSEKQQRIAPAIEYISAHYHQKITNDLLARTAGMSTVYFRKLFSEITGMPPIAYLHAFRIQKAKEMLKSDYGTLSDIAKSLGYLNLYDFSRAFKKYTGVSPSKYQ